MREVNDPASCPLNTSQSQSFLCLPKKRFPRPGESGRKQSKLPVFCTDNHHSTPIFSTLVPAFRSAGRRTSSLGQGLCSHSPNGCQEQAHVTSFNPQKPYSYPCYCWRNRNVDRTQIWPRERQKGSRASEPGACDLHEAQLYGSPSQPPTSAVSKMLPDPTRGVAAANHSHHL